MLVSILQRMGFTAAGARPKAEPSSNQGITVVDESRRSSTDNRWSEDGAHRHAEATAARSQEVKPQPKAAAKAQKPAAQAKQAQAQPAA